MGTSTAARQEFEDFQATRRFDALQQLRTLSVVAVIASHMQDPLWQPLHGARGVTVFFVVSGFLITTLLLREERREGRVRVGAFYLRRVFRLLPLYFLALATFAVLILGLHLGGQVEDFRRALPYYLTYQNDFAPPAPFGHSWSLAVEEKFYLVWPATAFLLPALRRHRLPVAAALLAVTVLAEALGVAHLATYAAILAGCLLAILMDTPRGFALVRPLTGPAVTAALVVLAVAAILLDGQGGEGGHLGVALAVVLALPGLVIGRGWMRRPSRLAWLVAGGQYTYAVYLIHPLVKSCLDEVLAVGQADVLVEVVRFVITTVVSFGAAAVLYRFYEAPFTALGHRLSRRRAPVAAPADRRVAGASPRT